MVLEVLYAWIHLNTWHILSNHLLLAVILDCVLFNFQQFGHSMNGDHIFSNIYFLSELAPGQYNKHSVCIAWVAYNNH